MLVSHGPGLRGLLSHLVLTELAASGGASRCERPDACPTVGRGACPRWPEEAPGRRQRAGGELGGIIDALDRTARLSCVSDPLTTPSLHRADHAQPMWQGVSRAEIFFGDTVLLKEALPETAPTSPARLLWVGEMRRVVSLRARLTGENAQPPWPPVSARRERPSTLT